MTVIVENWDELYSDYLRATSPVTKDAFILYAVLFSLKEHWHEQSNGIPNSHRPLMLRESLYHCKQQLQRDLAIEESFYVYENVQGIIEYFNS